MKLTLQEQLVSYSVMDVERLVRDRMGIECGFFKHESDRQMTAEEALGKYRRRLGVEHPTSSLKRDIRRYQAPRELRMGLSQGEVLPILVVDASSKGSCRMRLPVDAVFFTAIRKLGSELDSYTKSRSQGYILMY